MLNYNTQLKPLKLPEYGRNIQQMVDHCLTIEDREERTRCAHSIINAMSRLVPNLANAEEKRHKLWDHLAVMSDFQLDIDYPCEIVDPRSFGTVPEKIGLPQSNNPHRHYGKIIIDMIDKAAAMEPGEERQALTMLIANQMKKTLMNVFDEEISDARIFKDLEHLSHGELRLDPETVRLREYQIVKPEVKGKKKKKSNY